MMNEGDQGVLDRLFLTASLSCHQDENPGVFSFKGTGSPETAGRIPECLPLSGEASESSGDAEKESVVGGEDLGCDYWVVWSGGSVLLP